MVGKNTILNDNPLLSVRLILGKNPIRIFIDRNLEVPRSFNVYNTDAQTIVFNALKSEIENNITFIKLDFEKNVLIQITKHLFDLNIQSVLVEGGAHLLTTFLRQNIWEEVYIFQNPFLNFITGIKAPSMKLKNTYSLVGKDKLFTYIR